MYCTLKIADGLLIRFCTRTAQQYGNEVATPNMHMHCHLASCIKDYGPLHTFWLFSFERYNGLLGSMPNNNRAVEIQFQKRFRKDSLTLDLLTLDSKLPLMVAFYQNHSTLNLYLNSTLPVESINPM